MKRLFLAIPIPLSKEIISTLQQLQKAFDLDKIRWVPTENMHLTLKFFGNTPGKQIQSIIHEIEESLTNASPFELHANQLGIFGSRHSPKVLWISFKDNAALNHIKKELSVHLKNIGIEDTRENFVPHLTVARIDRIKHKDFFHQQIDTVKHHIEQTIPVQQLHLYESIFERSGVRYKIIHPFHLSS